MLADLKRRPALFEQIFQGGLGNHSMGLPGGLYLGHVPPANALQLDDLTTEDITFAGAELHRRKKRTIYRTSEVVRFT